MHTFILVLHVIGAAVLFGVIVGSIILVFSGPVTKEKLVIFKPIRIVGPIAAAWQLLTGIYLYFVDIDEFRDSRIFWIKIGLFVVDGIIAVLFVEKKIAMSEAKQDVQIIHKNKVGFWILANLLVLTSIIALGVILSS